MKPKIIACLSVCSVVCLLLAGCTSEKGNENNLIQFDVSASYPEKEIQLEDVAAIEYVQLEFDEDFLFSGGPSIITSDKIIFYQLTTGDFLFFSRAGKPLSKFNRRGNGPGEYFYTTGGPIYDEISDDFYVRLHNKIMVYSSSGKFKRSLPLPEGASTYQIVNYDSVTFLIYDGFDNVFPATFSLISKEDGSVVETVDMPMGQKLNLSVSIDLNEVTVSYQPDIGNIVKYRDGFLLADFSNDTIYYFPPKKELLPILVRKPKIHSMNQAITVSCFVEAGNYEFMYTEKVEYLKIEDGRLPNGLPKTYLMRDIQTGAVYRQNITFNDYKGKEVAISHKTIQTTKNSKLGLIVLGLSELQQSNRENKLSGKLKELVDNSDEYGNDIYMLLHFK